MDTVMHFMQHAGSAARRHVPRHAGACACARQLIVVLFSMQALSAPRAASRPDTARGARLRAAGAGAAVRPGLAGWGQWRADARTCAYHVLRTGLGLRGQERLRGGGSDSEEAGGGGPRRKRARAVAQTHTSGGTAEGSADGRGSRAVVRLLFLLRPVSGALKWSGFVRHTRQGGARELVLTLTARLERPPVR